MAITIDRTKCTGIGMCELTAPAIFEVSDDDAQSHVICDFDDADRGLVEEAVSACPTGALSWRP